MTREEARKKATEFVYCYCTWGDILYRCEMAGIPTKKKNGKYRGRTELEEELIDLYTENRTTE